MLSAYRSSRHVLTLAAVAALSTSAQAAFYLLDSDGAATTGTGFVSSPVTWNSSSQIWRLNTETGTLGAYPGGNHTVQFPFNRSGGTIYLGYSPVVGGVDAKASSTTTISDNGGTNTLQLFGTGTVNFGADPQNLVIAAVIEGTAGISKNGAATLILQRANTYTGSTTITRAAVRIDVDDALPTGTALALSGTQNNPRLDLNGNSQTVGSFSASDSSNRIVSSVAASVPTFTVNQATTTSSLAQLGTSTSDNYFGLTKKGVGTLTLGANNSTYRGATSVEAGVLSVAQVANSGAASAIGRGDAAGASTVSLGSASTQGTFRYTGAGHSTNRAFAVAGAGGGVIESTSGLLTLTGGVDTGGSPLTLAGAGAILIDTIGIAGNGPITKAGAGTVTVATGAIGSTSIDVQAGSLNLAGVSSIAPLVTLKGGGTLDAGANVVALAGSGTLSPGNSVGTLTINGALDVVSGSVLAFELNGANTAIGGTANDLVTGVAALTLNGTLNVTETSAGSFLGAEMGDSWRIINYSGLLSGNGLTLGTTPALSSGLSFEVDDSTPGQINLTVVPEPASIAVLVLGGLALRRRRG